MSGTPTSPTRATGLCFVQNVEFRGDGSVEIHFFDGGRVLYLAGSVTILGTVLPQGGCIISFLPSPSLSGNES